MTSQLANYEAAAAAFRAGAAAIPGDAWARPRAEGKWSPAEETEHIVLSHELFLSQLHGGPPMRAIVTGWKLVALRWLMLPWILRTGRFPRGARAPRESRPIAVGASRADLLARMDRAVRGVIAALAPGDAAMSRLRLRHPYFGMMTAAQVLELSTLHTRHHLATMQTKPAACHEGAPPVPLR